MTTTAELRAANGPHTPTPTRVSELDLPCRLVGANARPTFAAIDDPLLALRLFHRLAPHLPERVEGAELAAIKPVARCVRYGRGEGTTPHRDPIRETAEGFVSRASVVVFLNDNFEGGALSFPTLDGGRGREVEARAGRAVVFPHELLHGDELVRSGRKFVLEAEVFYAEGWPSYP
jgi:hypothetical protein